MINSTEIQIQFIEELAEIIARTLFNLKTEERTKELLASVQNSQKRQHALLENSSEIIVIYDSEGIITYESPSVKNILGYEGNQFIGQKIDEKFKKLFDYLIDNPEKKETIQLTQKTKNGKEIWMESTGRNLLNDVAIEGIIINSIDITERKKQSVSKL